MFDQGRSGFGHRALQVSQPFHHTLGAGAAVESHVAGALRRLTGRVERNLALLDLGARRLVLRLETAQVCLGAVHGLVRLGHLGLGLAQAGLRRLNRLGQRLGFGLEFCLAANQLALALFSDGQFTANALSGITQAACLPALRFDSRSLLITLDAHGCSPCQGVLHRRFALLRLPPTLRQSGLGHLDRLARLRPLVAVPRDEQALQLRAEALVVLDAACLALQAAELRR